MAARASKVQSCIFCDAGDCSAHAPRVVSSKPAVKFQAGVVQPTVTEQPVEQKPDPFGSFSPSLESDSKTRFKAIEQAVELNQDDLEMREALRNLADAGMICSTDLFRLKDLIGRTIPVAVEKKLAEWRSRNGKG